MLVSTMMHLLKRNAKRAVWLASLLVLVAGACAALGRTDTDPSSTQQADKALIASIRYLKDSRTNACFAYYWGGEANGGPALSEVPCESIPAELLTVGP
jgi:hypothetical protein